MESVNASDRPSRANIILFTALLFVSWLQAAALISDGRIHNNDFKHLWAVSLILVQGGDPYDARLILAAARQYDLGAINPYVYLPATGFLMSPLVPLAFKSAALVWFWFNLALAWVCVYWGPRWLGVDRRWLARAAGGLFIVGAMPFYRQMTAGQMNVVLVFAILASIGLLRSGKDLAAGAMIGAAAAYKIAPFFLILALLGMRRWRTATAGLVSFAAINLLSILWFGWNVNVKALPVLTDMSYGESTWAEFGNEYHRDPFNQSFNSLFHHLFTVNSRTMPIADLGPSAANAITWLASILLLLTLVADYRNYLRRPYFSGRWADVETALLLIAVMMMLLLPSIMWDHYAVQTLAGLMWVFGSDALRRRPLMIPAAILVFFLLEYPWRHSLPDKQEGFRILFISIRLWGTLGLLALLSMDWRDRMRLRTI